ncbi:TIGR02921 family PEP-CTERM protein [[Phormidium] sp. ETS-05]|uniref:TIGR02921 family PEP-CTERM protein n=1 Tax=[Phormidium] sp. ETS-05 TaxID=222819 RepID=UPI0018EEFD22|nr:TIGR02921 family PEP-CTERM protein [[Phormidium] sp. ETS-05]
MKPIIYRLLEAIFWLWNIAFLSTVYFGIMPYVGIPLIQATFEGLIPPEFFLTLMGLLAVPTFTVILAAKRFTKYPVQLSRLFYGVEAPLFMLCLLRLFVLRELTPATTLIIGIGFLCIATFGVNLVWGFAGEKQRLAVVQLLCHSLMMVVGLYGGMVLLFYAIPAATVFLKGFFSFEWLWSLWQMFTDSPALLFSWLPVFLLLMVLSGTIFLMMPVAVAGLYVQAGDRVWHQFAEMYGRQKTWIASLATVTASLLIFIASQQQPQINAFQLLANPSQTDTARQELLAKSDAIRDGLVNAYLYPYRYLNNWQDIKHIRQIYRKTFDISPETAQIVQNTYNQLMSPFLYQGESTDIDKAEKLYADFFDQPLQKAESAAIQKALKSTFNQDEVKAGLIDVNQQKVRLTQQNITIEDKGDWADIELYEVYENQTTEPLEIFYSFSLPESAVITGMWLGESENRAQRFPFQISPRGAAQQVYNDQVRRERPIDPALLEQVGPRHYRLRVFPIPPRQTVTRGAAQPKQHLWLTYKVMRQEKGWPLPDLGEKRNVYWTNKTTIVYNGKTVKRPDKDAWWPEYVPAAGVANPTLHRVDLPGGYRITAKPLAAPNYSLPRDRRFAVVLDTSRSMSANRPELQEEFKWLQDIFAQKNDVDLYLTAVGEKKPQRFDKIRQFDAAKVLFYGKLTYDEMLKQFDQLRGNTAYDGILLITDEGSYELSANKPKLPEITEPLWMVHLGGMPKAYDDATLKLIQDSRGGVAQAIPETLRRLATQADLGNTVVSVVDGYAWFLEDGNLDELPSELGDKSGFAPLAARQLILGLTGYLNPNDLGNLDWVHTIAKRFEIVSPYSSAIVLVNDQQKQALKAAELRADRFDREVETGTEELSNPLNTATANVPEPEMWLSGIIGVTCLLILKRRRRVKI